MWLSTSYWKQANYSRDFAGVIVVRRCGNHVSIHLVHLCAHILVQMDSLELFAESSHDSLATTSLEYTMGKKSCEGRGCVQIFMKIISSKSFRPPISTEVRCPMPNRQGTPMKV
ncbi:hypothetical protein DOTSEDRAFT_75209 [Dothistroma septosporum NZE10]|uniref:Uncharacterized protein n=1 Tax=Dothistroma septosporum (strain NZE10 / CBS 128990) TaxID=675120 RepID=M2XJ28_DOTSN|nr:hypothetical protein DOTSEDRAFT_75209 [Dothistroma septosporum NZE10]